MKRYGRLLWAAAMTAAALAVLAGFTAARGPVLLEWRISPQVLAPVLRIQTQEPEAQAAPEKDPDRLAVPEDALLVTVRDLEGTVGRKFQLTDAEGTLIRPVALNRRLECVLQVSPGHSYTLTAEDGQTAAFFLEENASITGVTGQAWTDGEVLYLETRARCALRVLRTMPAELVIYTLEGEGCCEDRTLYCPPEETMGQAVFTGLAPGTYILRGSDGTARTIELTEEMPEITVGLD